MPFENPLLDKLLTGVLEGRPVKIESDLIDNGAVELALNLIPISLSENQRNAITNAWNSEISYIQGPPGTGKSHTITALLLSAIFLNKRVLMVSHKKPAVEVVRNQVEKVLGEGSVIFLSSDKRELRGQLQQCCQDAATLTASRRVTKLGNEARELRESINRLMEEIEVIKARIRDCLTRESDYYKFNEEFLQHRKTFCEDFSIEANPDQFELATKLRNPEKYGDHLALVELWLQEKCV